MTAHSTYRHQNASGILVVTLVMLFLIVEGSISREGNHVRHYYDDEDWERVLKNRKFLTEKGRNENAAKLFQRDRNLQSSGFHAAGARTWNVLVCLMNWSNHGDRNKLPVADVQELFTGSGRNNPIHPGGSINDYFQAMSQGQFKLNVHVADWVKTSKSETFYTQDGSQGRTQEIQEAFTPVMQDLDNTNFDFSKYDSDGDNEIDLTVFLHSGYDGVYPGEDCQTGVPSSERVASHYRLRATESTWVSKSGYKLGTYVVSTAYYGNCDFEINGVGVIIHEITHSFGIPDLYDTVDFASTGYLGGIDYYGLMANPWQPGFDSRYPGPLMAWTKIQLGWVNPIEITGDGVYTIRAAAEAPDAYVINQGYVSGEYLLIENRQAIEGIYDERFFNPGGITIYHIDESIWSLFGFQSNKGNTPKGGPFLAGWPGNGKHYPVALLQADGLYELEQNINGGDSGDLYSSPDQVLGPGNGETEAKDANYPNTDAYAYGTITVTGITIKNFQYMDDGKTMTFEVTGVGPAQDPAPTNPPETSPTTNAPTASAPTPPTLVIETSVPTAISQTGEPTASQTTDTPTVGATKATEVPTISNTNTSVVVNGVACEGATVALVDGSPMPGSTVDSTGSVDTDFCGANITSAGQWFMFNGTGNSVEISACQKVNSDFDVSVSVFSGDSCAALTCESGLTFSDSTCIVSETSLRRRFLLEPPSILTLTTTEGMLYYVFVHGMNSSSPEGVAVGAFELFITEQLGDSPPLEDLPVEEDLEVNVTSNASLPIYFDVDSVTIVSPPTNGSASAQNVTTIVYSPEDNFVGIDSFDVKKCLDDGNCTKVTVVVDVVKGKGSGEDSDEKDRDTNENETTDDGGSSKNGLYALLVLLFLVPLLWIFRKRICGSCPFGAKKEETDRWDPTQPAGKSSKNLDETPFQDEEVKHGYTDDEDDDLGASEDDDADDDDDSEADDEEEETNESQVEEEEEEDEDDDEDEEDEEDATSMSSQDVQGDSDEEGSHKDIV
jgi:M6 family metalloprotease-like protein